MTWILNISVATLATVMLLASVWSFRASRKSVGVATWWFLVSYTVIAFSVVLRGFYWDVLRAYLRRFNPDLNDQITAATGSTNLNLVFWLMIMFGAYSMLKCRQYMLPVEERKHWPWYKVWTHPNGVSIFGLNFKRNK